MLITTRVSGPLSRSQWVSAHRGNGKPIRVAEKTLGRRGLSGLGRPGIGRTLSRRPTAPAEANAATFGDHRDRRGDGTMPGRPRAGGILASGAESMEVRVTQCGEGEGIGWRKVCAQRRFGCSANVVDNRGHEVLFLPSALRGGCVGRHQP